MQTFKQFLETKTFKPLGKETAEQRLQLAEYVYANDTTLESIQDSFKSQDRESRTIKGVFWYNDLCFILLLSDEEMETLIDRDYFNFTDAEMRQIERQLFEYVGE